jgi:hypothetical protein
MMHVFNPMRYSARPHSILGQEARAYCSYLLGYFVQYERVLLLAQLHWSLFAISERRRKGKLQRKLNSRTKETWQGVFCPVLSHLHKKGETRRGEARLTGGRAGFVWVTTHMAGTHGLQSALRSAVRSGS